MFWVVSSNHHQKWKAKENNIPFLCFSIKSASNLHFTYYASLSSLARFTATRTKTENFKRFQNILFILHDASKKFWKVCHLIGGESTHSHLHTFPFPFLANFTQLALLYIPYTTLPAVPLNVTVLLYLGLLPFPNCQWTENRCGNGCMGERNFEICERVETVDCINFLHYYCAGWWENFGSEIDPQFDWTNIQTHTQRANFRSIPLPSDEGV